MNSYAENEQFVKVCDLLFDVGVLCVIAMSVFELTYGACAWCMCAGTFLCVVLKIKN